MNILFIHQNFPSQFVHLSAELARQKRNKVVALSMHERAVPQWVKLRLYTLLRTSAPETHPLLQDQEKQVLCAEACAAAAMQLKREGFVPDVIVAHPGWGEALFIKDVFPQAKLLIYCEYYYAAEGQDVGFDPEEPPLSFQQRCKLRLRNSTNLLSLAMADAVISPTQWQKSTYPKPWQDKIHVIHDGIDIAKLKPNPEARLVLAANAVHGELVLTPGAEVLSYVARNLEAVRGFHIFMRLLPELQRQRPKAHIVVVGGTEPGYGALAPGQLSWKEAMLNEVGEQLDMSRLHFVGKVPYSAYLNLLNVSRVHAYWSTPFVLSWSLLEAALHGLPVVASATPPVNEFASRLGIATRDFFDQKAFVAALSEHLAEPSQIRRNRPAVEELDLSYCVARQIALIKE